MIPADSEACFTAWAPDGSPWSAWAKPVAFLLPLWDDAYPGNPAIRPEAMTVPTAITFNTNDAVIVDLPGEEAVHMGVALVRHGFRPVPLFNGTSGPKATIDVRPITRALFGGAHHVEQRQLAPDAPPAFLLDSRRNEPETAPAPGVYDNRWIVLPQDFPSGALLASRGIRFATVVRRGGVAVRTDLAHVLRRWQDHGIRTRVIDLGSQAVTDYVDIPKPSFFSMLGYATVALLGLRRSNVGGFGSRIPEQSSGGGYA
jgi:hypothetical protein